MARPLGSRRRDALPYWLMVGLSAGGLTGWLGENGMLLAQLPEVKPLPVLGTSRAGNIDLVELLWETSVQTIRSTLEPLARETAFGKTLTDGFPPRPLIKGSLLLLQDADGVRGLNLKTGHPAWPVSPGDAGFLLESHPEWTVEPASSQIAIGGAVLMGSRWLGVVDQQLVALDLNAEGRLDWSLRVEDLLGDLEAWGGIAGTPAVAVEGLVVPMQNDLTDSHVLVACSSAGNVQWRSGAVKSRAAGPPHPDAVVVSGETVYWNVAGCEIVALDGRTGATLWRTEVSPPSPFGRNEISARPAIFMHVQTVFALSRGVLQALDRTTGNLLWRHEFSSPPIDFLGVHGEMLILSGPELLGVDVQTRAVRWQIGGEDFAARGSGVGLLRQGIILWPTSAELWAIDVECGALGQRTPLGAIAGAGAGTLAIQGDLLVSVTDTHCRVFRIGQPSQ